ncbi:ABC-type nitrate/sulfonate/bicarbonate transport system permease component [Homoserinimonas aerilata]|uniref:ABC-type nitrate/sulfonate/bicarbonate transport system permease component n=1 Tax=Homoserinimonas aerilata TaxID=1162970 RepID=A0A542YJX7_9MICO|nr:ABC transporter permease [Homoserinimonas aerilata]TQL48397.1 ABC-type nitrate/sulfonate/bicarbonate transport system permease component [Homoserinimonas aerilata]
MTSSRSGAGRGVMKSLLIQAWLPILLVLLWFFASASSTSAYWPPLERIATNLVDGIFGGRLWGDIIYSFTNYFIGLAIALVIGLTVGIAVGSSAVLRNIFMPFLDFARASPPVVFVPIIILALGIGPEPKIFLIAFGCVWPILLNTVEGVRAIPASVIETARAYRIPVHFRVAKVILPGALPQIVVGVRIAITIGIVMLIVSEMYGSTQGVGFFILQSGMSFALADTWAGTIFIGIVGYVFTALFAMFEHRILRWYRNEAVPLSRRRTRRMDGLMAEIQGEAAQRVRNSQP